MNEAQGHTFRRLHQISPLSYLRHLAHRQLTNRHGARESCEIASSHLVSVLPTQAISQNMKCHRLCWLRVLLIKGHSRFMILCDGLTDHDHASTARLPSTTVFEKIFVKPFFFFLSHSTIQHAVPRANNAHSIVAIIKPATA